MTDECPDPDEIDTLDARPKNDPGPALEPDTREEQPRPGLTGLRGREIANYSLIRELGHGGQGFVYLAEDNHLGRLVALKIMPDALSFSDHHRLRFEREAEVASRLDHPGICTIYEAGEDKGIPFIAMQYVEGHSLKEAIDALRAIVIREDPKALDAGQPRPISTRSTALGEMMKLVHVIEEAARAVHHAHEAGLVHRDIKPANIMVSKGHALVLDFGLASDGMSHRESLTLTGDLIGTPLYMAAEQLRGDHSLVDRRSDVYSLGATLFECVTLRAPFLRPSFEALCRAIMDEEPPNPRSLNPRLPPELKLVLECAMDKDPARRYQTAEQFAEDLRRVRLREPVMARPVSRWLRAGRLAQRHPMAVTLTATAILVLAILTVVFYTKNSELDLKNRELAAANKKAEAESQRALEALADVERLSDSRILAALLARAETELWPAVPDKIEVLEEWLNEANTLVSRLPSHRALLDRIEASASSTAALDWQKDVLSDLVKSLDAFAGPGGAEESVKERLAFAQDLKPATIDAFADRWKTILSDLEQGPEDRRVMGLQPQLGLIPLGPDPDSGLQEFLHLASHSGPIPERAEDGRLQLVEDTGIVLVLIPARSFYMGSSKEESGPNFDSEALGNQAPVTRIELSAYFIAKHELTQAQWIKMTGSNPSAFGPGRGKNWGGLPRSLRQPVEQVNSDRCRRVLERFDLVLPTEARWECACRANTSTPFSCGNTPQSLAGFANIGDVGSAKFFPNGWSLQPDFDDGYHSHAPVGSMRPNAFGLHDMHGNVWEWCLDKAVSYKVEPREIDGLRIDESANNVTARGGSFHDPAIWAKSASRGLFGPTFSSYALGCRAARNLQ